MIKGPKEAALARLGQIFESSSNVENDLINEMTHIQNNPAIFPALLLEKEFDSPNRWEQKNLIEIASQRGWKKLLSYIEERFAVDPKVAQALKQPAKEESDVGEFQLSHQDIQEAVPDEVITLAKTHGFVKANESFSVNKHHTHLDGRSLFIVALLEQRMEVAKWLETLARRSRATRCKK